MPRQEEIDLLIIRERVYVFVRGNKMVQLEFRETLLV